jgi:hypothetical protein
MREITITFPEGEEGQWNKSTSFLIKQLLRQDVIDAYRYRADINELVITVPEREEESSSGANTT